MNETPRQSTRGLQALKSGILAKSRGIQKIEENLARAQDPGKFFPFTQDGVRALIERSMVI